MPKLVLILLALLLASVVATASASSSRDGSTTACLLGGVRAVIEGKRTCLWPGLRCRRRFDAQYRRYGFACPRGGLTVVSRWRIRDLGSLPGLPDSRATGNQRTEALRRLGSK